MQPPYGLQVTFQCTTFTATPMRYICASLNKVGADQLEPQPTGPSGAIRNLSRAQCPSCPPLFITEPQRRHARPPMAVMMVCLDRSGCTPLRACSMRGMVVSKLCALPAHRYDVAELLSPRNAEFAVSVCSVKAESFGQLQLTGMQRRVHNFTCRQDDRLLAPLCEGMLCKRFPPGQYWRVGYRSYPGVKTLSCVLLLNTMFEARAAVICVCATCQSWDQAVRGTKHTHLLQFSACCGITATEKKSHCEHHCCSSTPHTGRAAGAGTSRRPA